LQLADERPSSHGRGWVRSATQSSASNESVIPASRGESEFRMNMTLSIAPLISLIAGILILVVPRFLNYIVAIYLIVVGLVGLFGAGNMHLR
jgi:hypothetical protein